MQEYKLFFYLLFILLGCSCAQNTGTEKHQKNRNNIIDLRDKVKEIEIADALISNIAWSYIFDDYLIVLDYKYMDKCIHIFDKNNFTYITSTGERGEGPEEILRPDHIGIDKNNRKLYVTDIGQQKILSFDLDSILTDTEYTPIEKVKFNGDLFPSDYKFIHDTLSIGCIMEPLHNDFQLYVGKWNMNTGEVTRMPYEHPAIKKRRISVATSAEHNTYVECYWHHDLMTIGTLNGELLCNIYGKKWDTKVSNKFTYYGNHVAIYGDKIFTLYSGEETFYQDKVKGLRALYPSKFMIFDINGDYLQTLETGRGITHFCYDEDNNRIIMNLEDDIEFAYLDLNGVVL